MKVLPKERFEIAAATAQSILFVANMRIMSSKGPDDLPKWCIRAKPYLHAIAGADYGLEDPAMVVLQALNLLQGWHGRDARLTKLALSNMLVEE